jgi:glutathione peroxidase
MRTSKGILFYLTRVRKNILCIYSIFIFFVVMAGSYEISAQESPFHNLSAKLISGETVKLSKFKGDVVLVVNTASRCGFTPQYKSLQELYLKYKERGFTILGFPSNDFAGQEPGSNEEIKKFCDLNYKVSFPMFVKDHVKGENKQEVYKYLTEATSEQTKGEIGWNFEKFLISKQGIVEARFGSFTNPMSTRIAEKIEKLLSEK